LRTFFTFQALKLKQISRSDKVQKYKVIAHVKTLPAKDNFNFFDAVAIKTNIYGETP
jgi:hypothetical protein